MQKVVVHLAGGVQLVSPPLHDEESVLEYKESFLELLERYPYVFEQLTTRGAQTLIVSKETVMGIEVLGT